MHKSLKGTNFARRCLLPAVVALLVLPALARADWVLWDWSANIDGSTYNPPGLPATVNSAGFDFSTGLGNLTFSFNTAGAHYAGVYLSHYFDTYFGNVSDAYASVGGALPADVTYEIGVPGVVTPSVFDDFAANALANTNTVTGYSPPPTACCDVAMAMLTAFTLNAGETATLTYSVGPNQPGGFYLQETDHDTGNSIYLSERFTTSGVPAIPEPATIVLFGTVAVALLSIERHRRMKRSE